MNPAQKVIKKFGGVRVLAEAIGMQTPGVYKWTYEKERGGTGGLIPSDKQVEVVAAAKRLNVDLSASDFFPEDSFQGAAE